MINIVTVEGDGDDDYSYVQFLLMNFIALFSMFQAQRNTKLLWCYSEIDPRVKILGYAVKIFAKVIDIVVQLVTDHVKKQGAGEQTFFFLNLAEGMSFHTVQMMPRFTPVCTVWSSSHSDTFCLVTHSCCCCS